MNGLAKELRGHLGKRRKNSREPGIRMAVYWEWVIPKRPGGFQWSGQPGQLWLLANWKNIIKKFTSDFEKFAEEVYEESLLLTDKEVELIKKALEKHAGKRKYAANELGISERTLYRKIKEYNLE